MTSSLRAGTLHSAHHGELPGELSCCCLNHARMLAEREIEREREIQKRRRGVSSMVVLCGQFNHKRALMPVSLFIVPFSMEDVTAWEGSEVGLNLKEFR